MQSRRDRWQEDIFVACPLSDLVPDDHILKRVDEVLDLDWLHEEVAECYCQNNGRPSIDPESALRLMLAGFLEGIFFTLGDEGHHHSGSFSLLSFIFRSLPARAIALT